MRLQDNGDSFTVWISAAETDRWARRWPCSTLSDRRICASFDTNGLYDLAIDGQAARDDIDGHELSVVLADHLADRLEPEHPCYFVAVGQFQGGDR